MTDTPARPQRVGEAVETGVLCAVVRRGDRTSYYVINMDLMSTKIYG
jgi:hypothetical protein